MRSTGLTEQRIADMARDNLRIAGYLDQRRQPIAVQDDSLSDLGSAAAVVELERVVEGAVGVAPAQLGAGRARGNENGVSKPS